MEIGKRFRIFRTRQSYFRQDIRRSEYIGAAVRTLVLTIGIGYLFYESIIAAILLIPFGGWYFLRWEGEQIRKKQEEFQIQFREAIGSISTSMRVGYSVENAMKETKKDLNLLYSEDTAIQREFTYMVGQVYLQVPMEQIMEEWADRMQQEDVRNFVNVFVMARRSGGNTLEIIRNSSNQIRDKLEVKSEIATMLAARRYEFKVMSVIPFGMLIYMKISFPEFMGILYGNALGIGVMSGCLAVYFGAYLLGQTIVNIEV